MATQKKSERVVPTAEKPKKTEESKGMRILNYLGIAIGFFGKEILESVKDIGKKKATERFVDKTTDKTGFNVALDLLDHGVTVQVQSAAEGKYYEVRTAGAAAARKIEELMKRLDHDERNDFMRFAAKTGPTVEHTVLFLDRLAEKETVEEMRDYLLSSQYIGPGADTFWESLDKYQKVAAKSINDSSEKIRRESRSARNRTLFQTIFNR